MSHKVEIADRTFEDLREYCKLNDLKIGQFADKLIREGLMIEMYGDVPFTNYRKPASEVKEIPVAKVFKVMEEKAPQENIPPEIGQAIQDHWFEMIDDDGTFEQEKVKPIDEETKAQMIETMEKVEAEHPQTYITNQEGEKEIQKEMLKQLGVPDKVVSKITRRRLK